MTAPRFMPEPDSIELRAFKGLVNTMAAERLALGDLQEAINIDLDDSGQVHRRRGTTKVADGNFHSLYAAKDGRLFVVKNGALCRLYDNYITTSLGITVGDAPLAYVEVAQRIYCASETTSGIIERDDTVSAWGAYTPGTTEWVSPIVHPSATLPDVRGRLLANPPTATDLAYFNGRIYLAQGRTVWATEHHQYLVVDRTRGFLQLEADVTMLKAVRGGLFVGTTQDVGFINGEQLAEFTYRRVLHTGAVRGSCVEANAEWVSPGEGVKPAAPAIMFLTAEGIYVGMDNGSCVNRTADRMEFPTATNAAAMFRQQDGMTQYVVTTETGGTPRSSARIGDYVDAEIIRRSGV